MQMVSLILVVACNERTKNYPLKQTINIEQTTQHSPSFKFCIVTSHVTDWLEWHEHALADPHWFHRVSLGWDDSSLILSTLNHLWEITCSSIILQKSLTVTASKLLGTHHLHLGI